MTIDLKDSVRPLDATALLRLLPERPHVLALGEPTHGEDALLELRNDLVRQLVEEGGYGTVALESDCLRGLAVDAYVTRGAGTLDGVLEHGFSHGWGASAANRELVRWMRAHNARADAEGRPASARVRFAGFDGPLEISAAESPRQALTGLYAFLAARLDADLLPCTEAALGRLLGADERWTDPAAMTDPSRSVGRSADAVELRLLADDLTTLLEAEAPHLSAPSGGGEAGGDGEHADAGRTEGGHADAWDRARLYARTATGLLRYHAAMADDSPSRVTRLCALRDVLMAANLAALAERGPLLVHAHNSHLQRGRSSMRMWQGRVEWWGAGALTAVRLGGRYAFVATAVGTLRHQGVDVPPPESVEGLLYGLPEDRQLVDPVALAAALGGTPPAPRESPWFGYAPFDPALLAGTDGLVYVRDVPARPRTVPGWDAPRV
ncbi:erythromycin esterase family protein [Streptomyces phytohabitans]|uniref:erythromycin esterase family protein n=1 Tax=Streptomyces phytohabitans TaxID=1150371 RepID=UPI00345B5C90